MRVLKEELEVLGEMGNGGPVNIPVNYSWRGTDLCTQAQGGGGR